MTQIEYIDFIRNSLPMVDKTAKFHREQVKIAINTAMNTVFYEMYASNPKSFMKSMERYTDVIIVQVAIGGSGSTLRYISTIGATIDVVDLPRKTGGIMEVYTKTQLSATNTTTTKFIPVTTMEGEQFYGSEASLPAEVIGYSWSGVRQIEYWGMDATTAGTGAHVRLIKQFKSFSSTDEIILPYGQDQRIIQLVREFLGATPPKDLVNNNADG